MIKRSRLALGGALLAVALLGGTTGVLLAQPRSGQPAITHEQMDQMMDAIHGEGTSQRMHEAMGPDAERLMEQCVAMMNMMQGMQGMMAGQTGEAMQDMMNGMTGR